MVIAILFVILRSVPSLVSVSFTVLIIYSIVDALYWYYGVRNSNYTRRTFDTRIQVLHHGPSPQESGGGGLFSFLKNNKEFGTHEKIKRRYKSDATLHVTNMRLIYTSKKQNVSDERGNSSIYQLNVRDVGDISIVDAKWRALLVPILSILLGLCLLVFIIGIIFIVWGILKLIRGNSIVYLAISGKDCSGGLLVGKASKLTLNEIYFAVKPGPDFDKMASELGTLILDLQVHGDECFERWM